MFKMNMTTKEAYEILEVPEGASMDEVKRQYTTIALTNHPDQKASTPETIKIFEEASMAYKRLRQRPQDNWVKLTCQMEQFSSIFRFRMKTDNGYVYFMYNPYTGLTESDDEDINSRSKRQHKKLEFNSKWNEERKIVEVDPMQFKEMQLKANKCAEELLDEEDQAKKKAAKRKKKKLRQKEKKKQAKEEMKLNEDNEKLEETALEALKDHQRKLLHATLLMSPGSSFKEFPIREENRNKIDKIKKSTEETSRNSKKEETNRNRLNGVMRKVENETNIKAKRKVEKSTIVKVQPTRHKEERKLDTDSGSETKSSEDEPQWDEESAFFSKALKNSKIKRPTATSPTLNENDDKKATLAQDSITVSRHLAMEGNQKAGSGEYNEAVKLFTKAISLYNTDCRYYGNRSYCYDRLEFYDRALVDANTAISLSSCWAKGYFRKGRALAGLKRYVDAERSFEEVLKLDKHCFDAEQELHNVRINHLTDMGFSKDLCEVALRKKGTIQLALDELLSGVLAGTELKDVYVSDEEDEALMEAELLKDPIENNEDAYTDVNYNSLWVGNMTKKISEKALVDYFGQFGQVTGITAMYLRRCAFVNFASTEAAKRAILARDTVEICGVILVIRYPDRAFSNVSKPIVYKNQRECIYWRNRGCHFGSNCRYLHITANKGIDLQTVERTPYQSIVKL